MVHTSPSDRDVLVVDEDAFFVAVALPLAGAGDESPVTPAAPREATTFEATFLWPPSFQCTFWHSTEQYHACDRARER
jgi:hypothetical protein